MQQFILGKKNQITVISGILIRHWLLVQHLKTTHHQMTDLTKYKFGIAPVALQCRMYLPTLELELKKKIIVDWLFSQILQKII